MTMMVGQAPRRRGGTRRLLTTLVRGPDIDLRNPRRWARQAIPLTAGVAAVLSSIVYLYLALYHYRIPFLQLWLAATALLLVSWLLRAVATRPLTPVPPFDSNEAELGARPFAIADRWQQRLSMTHGDVEWYTRVVRERLRRIAAERLRQRHGVRLGTQPDAARAILGPSLYEFLTEPLPRTPTPVETDRLITRIEEI